MPQGIITYAAEITEQSVHDIVRNAVHWSLTVDAEGAMEEAADFGETAYGILSVNWDLRYATFTTMWKTDFFNTWHFEGDHIHGTNFRSIELNAEAR